jgi:hypothetical protein
VGVNGKHLGSEADMESERTFYCSEPVPRMAKGLPMTLSLHLTLRKLLRSAHAKWLKSKQKLNELCPENLLVIESVGIWPHCVEDLMQLSLKPSSIA